MRGAEDGEQGNGAGQWGTLVYGQADLPVPQEREAPALIALPYG